jgi:hypothetical protein
MEREREIYRDRKVERKRDIWREVERERERGGGVRKRQRSGKRERESSMRVLHIILITLMTIVDMCITYYKKDHFPIP